jgi:phage anti-repressor protein
MQELIQITTGGQGLPVVSARALYDFLGFDSSQWRRWSLKNIVRNPYAQSRVDWEVFDTMSKTSQGGRPTVDYSLSIDFAKRLSMLAPTEKGEEVRQYLLDCEAAQLPEQASVNARLTALEKQVDQLLEREQIRLLIEPTPLSYPMAIETTRAKVARLVNQYAEAHYEATYTIWSRLWSRLHIVYGFNVRAQRKTNYENLLDLAERYGQMERIHAILTTEFVVQL